MTMKKTLLALALAAAFALPAQAANRVWDCDGDYFWDIATCWNPDGVPGAADNVSMGTAYFGMTGNRLVTIDAVTAHAYASYLYLDNLGSFQVSIAQTGGTLHVTNNATLGINGNAGYVQSGGTNAVGGGLYLGNSSKGLGAYYLSGGTLAVGWEHVGLAGLGSVSQSAGSHTVGIDLNLGYAAGSQGGYDLSGTGKLAAVYENIGVSGAGTFTHNAGTNTVSNALTLGNNVGGSGTYRLYGGTLNVASIVNGAGNGRLTIDGGTLNLTGTALNVDVFEVGAAAGKTGSFTLASGKTFGATDLAVGRAGTGSFVQNGGSGNVSSEFTVGTNAGSSGAYTLSGSGALQTWIAAIGQSGNGKFNQSGGTHGSGGLMIASGPGSSGEYNLSGTGALNAINLTVGNLGTGTLNQSGGTNTVSGVLTLGAIGGGTGSYTLSGGTLTVAKISNGAGTGTFNLSGGTLVLTGSTIDVDRFNVSNSGPAGYAIDLPLSTGQTLTAGVETIDSVALTQRAGTHLVTGSLQLGNAGGKLTPYRITGGLLKVGGIVGAQGFMMVDGGTLDLAGQAININAFEVGSFLGSEGSFTLATGRSLTAAVESIGTSGTGHLTQTGGTHALTNHLSLGYSGTGNFVLGGGSLTTPVADVGVYGVGSFTQDGGTHVVSGPLTLGVAASGSGSYTLNGGSLQVNTIADGAGTGTLNLDGGVLNVTGGAIGVDQFNLGNAAGRQGSFTLGAGRTLNTTVETIGVAGSGSFVQNGGTNTVATDLVLGLYGNGSGSYTLNGGTLSVGGILGGFGSSRFDLNGGSLQLVGSSIRVGSFNLGSVAGSSGTFVVGSGQTLTATQRLAVGGTDSGPAGSGALGIGSGGTVFVDSAFKLWSTGTLTLAGGTLDVGSLDAFGPIQFHGGLVRVFSDLTLNGDGGPGSLALNAFGTLTVGGTTTLKEFSTLTLNGGSFSTGSLVNPTGFAFNAGTFSLTGDNLVIGAGGLFGSHVAFDARRTVVVTNEVTVDSGAVLGLENALFTAGSTTNNGTVDLAGSVSVAGGTSFTNHGLLTGNGTVAASLTNGAGGEVRVTAGDTLGFTASGNANDGQLNLLGGTAVFTQGLTNNGPGLVTGHGALIAPGGLTNTGTLAFTATTDVQGPVANDPGGAIVVAGQTTTFYDDVVNNGAEFRVTNGAQAVFFGAYSGGTNITGPGAVVFAGALQPGNSPALIDVQGDMSLLSSSVTTMELGGLTRGTQYDAFDVGTTLLLGGTLDVVLYDLGGGTFTPQAGDSFDLFAATTVQGSFGTLHYAPLAPNLAWRIDYLTDAVGTTDVVRLSVTAVPEPGSYALLLAGLGLVGAAARRRRHQG